jgi:hypothetical protein
MLYYKLRLSDMHYSGDQNNTAIYNFNIKPIQMVFRRRRKSIDIYVQLVPTVAGFTQRRSLGTPKHRKVGVPDHIEYVKPSLLHLYAVDKYDV